MAKLGKISTIKREFTSSQLQTMDSGLAQKGMTGATQALASNYQYQ